MTDKIQAGIVINDEDREFTVVVYLPGARAYDAELGDLATTPVVAFYDRTYKNNWQLAAALDWSEFGQFTGGSYYLTTLREGLGRMKGGQLSLHGDVPEWTITEENVRAAVCMADAVILSNSV